MLWQNIKWPLEVNTRLDCKWRDGQFHTARIVERRQIAGKEDYEYYVHYLKCKPLTLGSHFLPFTLVSCSLLLSVAKWLYIAAVNRRMDEWVRKENFDLSTIDPPESDVPNGDNSK